MKYIVNVDPFDDFFYKYCLYNPLLSALKFYGINLSAFWSNDYFVYEFKDNIFCSSIKTVCSEEDICRKFGIQFKCLEELSYENLISSIQEKKLLLVTIDKFYWNNIEVNKDYQKKHIKHFFLVCGVDTSEKTIFLIDVYKDLFRFDCFKSTISFDNLFLSYSGYKYRNPGIKDLIVEISTEDPTYKTEDFYSVFLSNMKVVLPELKMSLENIRMARNFFVSLENDLEKFVEISKVSVHLPKHHKEIQKNEYKKILGDFPQLLNSVEVSGNAYRHFIFLLIDISTTEKASSHLLSRAVNYIDEIYTSEIFIYTELNKMFSQNNPYITDGNIHM